MFHKNQRITLRFSGFKFMANCAFHRSGRAFTALMKRLQQYEMAMFCWRRRQLALQPALAEDLFGNHPLTPEARDAFVTVCSKDDGR